VGFSHVTPRGCSAAPARTLALLCWLAGCTGTIDGEPLAPGESYVPRAGSGGGAANGGNAGNGGGGAGNGGGAADSGGGGSSGDEAPSPATRAARLTHRQYANTLRDLLNVPMSEIESAVADLRPDPAQAGFLFDNDSLTLSVDGALFGSYQRVAASLAERVVGDAALLDQATGGGDAEAFVRSFGLRAHRRPLDDAEVSEYLALHAMGATLEPARPAFEAGTRLVIEAMLLAPSFLYRLELSGTEAGAVIPLDSYEVASRLSYALWSTMPDPMLFQAAADGALTDSGAVAEHAERLLSDPRAEAMVAHFHEQLFETEKFASIEPSDNAFPDISSELGAYALEEHERFVRAVVFERDGDYAELLTSNETFVNADLAEIYGLSGTFTDAFVPATLAAGERRGILTQVGFLAANATSTTPDPIHRGVFIARRIACLPLAAPPAEIPPLPEPEGRTNREVIESHTQEPGTVCSMCHTPIINPLGFPFESFDAVGAFRTEDNGQMVDTRTSAPVSESGAPVDVANALELADALAASVDVHSCYTKHWIEQLNGRAVTSADDALRERLGEASARGEITIRELIAALVTSPAFLTRSTQELP
jgi:hypothetical protein